MKSKKSILINIVLILGVLLILYPPTGNPIKVFAHKLLSFTPLVRAESDRTQIKDYKWTLKRVSDGRVLNFSETKGKVVLVNLWATWCPPCIAEMPSLEALYKDYGEKIDFLFVTNDKHNRVLPFMKKNQYSFEVYNPLTPVPDELYSRSIPATYLISKDGKIVIEKKGAADWNSDTVRTTIENLLTE
jgi:thiol-disulfide isomerase/thioredoxin